MRRHGAAVQPRQVVPRLRPDRAVARHPGRARRPRRPRDRLLGQRRARCSRPRTQQLIFSVPRAGRAALRDHAAAPRRPDLHRHPRRRGPGPEPAALPRARRRRRSATSAGSASSGRPSSPAAERPPGGHARSTSSPLRVLAQQLGGARDVVVQPLRRELGVPGHGGLDEAAVLGGDVARLLVRDRPDPVERRAVGEALGDRQQAAGCCSPRRAPRGTPRAPAPRARRSAAADRRRRRAASASARDVRRRPGPPSRRALLDRQRQHGRLDQQAGGGQLVEVGARQRRDDVPWWACVLTSPWAPSQVRASRRTPTLVP